MKSLNLLLLLFLTLIITYIAKPQNLVIDGSFENYVLLPDGFSVSEGEIKNPESDCGQDFIMNCLCDRITNVTYDYPKFSNLWTVCKGWVNPSYNLEFESNIYFDNSTPDYFNANVGSPYLCSDNNLTPARGKSVEVPSNMGNYYNTSRLPLVPRFLTYPHHGDAYIGMWTARGNSNAIPPYTEYIAQKLDQTNQNNYLKEGNKYNISFRVSRARTYIHTKYGAYTDSGHFLKKLSLFLWDEPLKLDDTGLEGIKTTEFQKEKFMVDEHNDTTGYLTAEGEEEWNLISEVFIPEKKLNFIYIGNFDYDIDSLGSSLLKVPDQISTANAIPDTSLQDVQAIYYYVDSVIIDSIGTVEVCDCDSLEFDVVFRPPHSYTKDTVCEAIYVKVEGQSDYCKLSKLRYREGLGDWEYLSIIDDLNLTKLENGIYYPIDTVCYNDSRDNDTILYNFEFKNYGVNSYSCTKPLSNVIKRLECPCEWILKEGLDSIDNNKLAIRLESQYIGKDSNNNCCYNLYFINNGSQPILTDLFEIKIDGTDNPFQNLNPTSEYYFENGRHRWILPYHQISKGDTLQLGSICISDSIPVKIFWNLYTKSKSNSYIKCILPTITIQPHILTCDECCPDVYLIYNIESNIDNCCIYITDFSNGGCSVSEKYFKIDNGLEEEINLPYELCEDNSDMKFRVKLYDENESLVCIKNYDFSEEVENCDCCEFTDINVIRDINYTGSGCKFNIGSIYNTCGFDNNTLVEYGKFNDMIYDSLGTFVFGSETNWEYILEDCDIDTLVFKFIDNNNVVCEKTLILECQTCEGVFIKVELQGDTNSCCLRLVNKKIYDDDNCKYYLNYAYEYEDIPVSINLNGTGFSEINFDSDTIVICGTSRRNYNDSLDYANSFERFLPSTRFYYGIYDKYGNRICRDRASIICDYFENYYEKSIEDNKSEQELITNNIVRLNTFNSKTLFLAIYDLKGNKLLDRNFENLDSQNLDYNLGNLTSGVYLISVELESGYYNKLINVVK